MTETLWYVSVKSLGQMITYWEIGNDAADALHHAAARFGVTADGVTNVEDDMGKPARKTVERTP